MAYKTIMLQIYKPSRYKRELMDRAILNYSQALDHLLEKNKDKVMDIAGSVVQISRSKLIALIDKDTLKELNNLHVQPFKDSLKIDFAASAARFIAQYRMNNNTGYPKINTDGSESGYYPIYFGRYAVNRDYCLLYDKYSDRFYAKLYLMNLTHRITYEARAGRLRLKHVADGMPPLYNQTGKKRYIVTPLAFGESQYRDLKKALHNPDILHTARLLKRKDKYYLMVTMGCASDPPMETMTTMGVARSIHGGLHYTVCSDEGNIIAKGCEYADKADHKLHILTKRITETALEYKAQVIVGADGAKSDKLMLSMDSTAPVMKPQEYSRVVDILRYKLPEKRLPPPVQVSSNGLCLTCPRCQNRTKKNHLASEIFACVECGFAARKDWIGSLNLAIRLRKYKQDKVPIYTSESSDGKVFYNKTLGFRCMLSMETTDYEQVYYELSLMVHSYIKPSDDNKKHAMLKKLREYPTIRDAVRIVSKK